MNELQEIINQMREALEMTPDLQEKIRKVILSSVNIKRSVEPENAWQFGKMTLKDEWEPIVLEQESHIPWELLPKKGRRGSNAKITSYGKAILPNEGYLILASTVKGNEPDEYEKIIKKAKIL